MTASTAELSAVIAAAESYFAAGLAVTAWEPRHGKAPRVTGWQKTPYKSLEQLQPLLDKGMTQLGLLHEHSMTGTLDIDSPRAVEVLEYLGLDLTDLQAEAGACIVSPSGAVKPLYRLPPELGLRYQQLRWLGSDGKLFVLLELRTGEGKQDVLPPSVHPKGGRYQLQGDVSKIALPPAELIQVWQDFKGMQDHLEHLSPWAPKPQAQRPSTGQASHADSVIQKYNAVTPLRSLLELYDYKITSANKYCAPQSTTGIPGVVIFPKRTREGDEVAFIHHASHPLLERYADSFDLYALHEHGGDKSAATKAAAKALGMTSAPRAQRPSTAQPESDEPSWGDIVELPEHEAATAPELPAKLLPQPLRDYCTDRAELTNNSPLQFVAIPLLCALGVVLGNKLGIQPKSKDTSYVETPNLWGVVCAPPSRLKSSCVSAGLEPLRYLDKKAAGAYELERLELQTAKAAAKAALVAAEKALGKAEDTESAKVEHTQALYDLEQAAENDKCKKYIINDPTPEKLIQLFEDYPHARLLYRDEIAGWLAQFDKPNYAGARQLYLQAWQGWASYTQERVGGTRAAEHFTVGIVGTLQPWALRRYLAESEHGGGDGLLQRLQLFVLDSEKPPSVCDRAPNDKAQQDVYDLFDVLEQAEPEQLGAVFNKQQGRWVFKFDHTALQYYLDWLQDLEQHLRAPEVAATPGLQAHLGKYRGLMPTLALLLHLAGGAEGDIPLETAMLAEQWCTWLEHHARALYAAELHAPAEAEKAVELAITQGKVKHGMTARAAYRVLGMSKAEAEAVLERLEARHVLRRVMVKPAGRGRPSEQLHIHPDYRGE